MLRHRFKGQFHLLQPLQVAAQAALALLLDYGLIHRHLHFPEPLAAPAALRRRQHDKLGPARVKTTYAFESLRRAGAILAFGSDWTVAPLSPILGIYAAVTRRTLDGKNPGGWVPEEKVSVEEAVRAYTMNGAYAEFSEATKGTIEAGKLADLVVLDRDIFSVPPEEIGGARVRMTVFDGRIVYGKDR